MSLIIIEGDIHKQISLFCPKEVNISNSEYRLLIIDEVTSLLKNLSSFVSSIGIYEIKLFKTFGPELKIIPCKHPSPLISFIKFGYFCFKRINLSLIFFPIFFAFLGYSSSTTILTASRAVSDSSPNALYVVE